MIRFFVNMRQVAVFVASLLLSAQLVPSVALACEGTAEEQRISLTPIESGERNRPSGTRTCENARREVVFTIVEQWCEYEVKNNNAREEVTVEVLEAGYERGGECERLLCLGTLVPIRRPLCEAGRTRLVITRECYISVEYLRKPRARERALFRVRTRSTGNQTAEPTARLILE
jgi:hypothetical protein